MPARSKVIDEAFVTLATSDSYAIGALVLSSSLKRINTNRQLVVMVTPGVTQPMRDQLLYAFDAVVHVNVLDSNDASNLKLLGRSDLGQTFTKLHCWRLTQYTKCVFMDADTLVLKNIDDLFDREELSAAPDVGWPDCFNSGVFVYHPSEETYASLLQFALTVGSFDGGDQGLLNQYFSGWATKDISRHLPFLYNVVGHSFYSYLPAFFQFGQATKVAHFIGAVKPWHLGFNRATGQLEAGTGDVRHVADFVYIWWRIFMEDVHHRLILDLASLVNVFERHPPPPPPPVHHAPPPPPPAEPVNYQMTTPYVPPNIPVYYEPPPPPPAPYHAPPSHHTPPPEPVYMPPHDSRPYTHMESFYSEPPMTHTDSYTRPDIAYDAKEVCQTWNEFIPKPESPPDLPAEPEHVEPAPAAVEAAPVAEDKPEEPAAEIAEPSNLEVVTKDNLEDHQHQMNWERGQIDYLGVDSFDNILHQIDFVISQKTAEGTPRRSASEGNVRPLKSRGKGTPRRQGSYGDGVVQPADEAEVRSEAHAATSASPEVATRIGPEVGKHPEQSDREEIVIQTNGRAKQLVPPEELDAQSVSPKARRRPLRGSPKGPVFRKPKGTDIDPPPVDRVEHVIRTSGRRQELISEADLASLETSPLNTSIGLDTMSDKGGSGSCNGPQSVGKSVSDHKAPDGSVGHRASSGGKSK